MPLDINQIYLTLPHLPGYVEGVWCERIHLTLDDLSTGIGEGSAPAPFVNLRRRHSAERIAVPLFVFAEDGGVLPPRLEMFSVPPEEHWVMEEIERAIRAARDSYGETPRRAYMVTAELWPNSVGVITADYEVLPDPTDFTVDAVEPPVLHDHLVAGW